MRLFELELQEVREYLDTEEYGSWVNVNTNEIISVAYGEDHSEHVRKLYPGTSRRESYLEAFKDGFVRVVHSTGYYALDIEGYGRAIKKSWKLIRPTAMRMTNINIDIDDTGESYIFVLPHDRSKLIELVANL